MTTPMETSISTGLKPNRSLEVFPEEIWRHLFTFLDLSELYAIKKVTVSLDLMIRPTLLSRLLLTTPLFELYALTEKLNPPLTTIQLMFRMHHHMEDYLSAVLPPEPEKYTDEVREWEDYNEDVDEWVNLENFRKVARKGRARSRAHSDWEIKLNRERKALKRELARCWSLTGKFFPFNHAENKEWKQKKDYTNTKKSPRKDRRKSSCGKIPPEQKRKSSESEVDFHFAEQFANFKIGPNPTGPRRQRRPSHEQLERAEAQFQQVIKSEFSTLQQYYPTGNNPNPERFTLDSLRCALRRFRWDDDACAMRCPISLSSYHRKFMHQEAFDLGGLKSVSFGDGDARFLVIVKRNIPLG